MIYDIVFWKEKLRKPAGLQAQLLMAPKLRKEELEIYSNVLPQQKSAVLVLIYFDTTTNKSFIVLTLRSNNLRAHSGQVSFPGGKMEKDDKSIEDTALREAEEEIGINRNLNIEIIGHLSPLIIPITGFKVYPVVGFLQYKPDFNINTDEVEKLLLIPLEDLASNNSIKQKIFSKSTSEKGHSAPYFDIAGVEIWGATAMVLSELIVTLFPDSDFINHQLSFYPPIK